MLNERRIGRVFRVSLVLKGVDGLLELVGGMLLLVVSPASIHSAVRWMTAHELAEDPNDFVARHLLRSASQLSRGTTLFGAVYLITHGLAKLFLVIEVLRSRLWAYPLMIGLVSAFIVYQLYRMTYRPSAGLALLTAFDVLVVWLTWHEYRRQRRGLEPV